MDVQPLDVVRWILQIGGLGLVIFTVGALVGWRWASPGVKYEPTWLFLLVELSWLPIIGALFLNEPPPGWWWFGWLPPIVLVLYATAFVLRLRARGQLGIGPFRRSGGREAP